MYLKRKHKNFQSNNMNEIMHKALFPNTALGNLRGHQWLCEKTQLGTIRDHKYCKWHLQRKIQKEEWSQLRIIKCVEGKKQTLKEKHSFWCIEIELRSCCKEHGQWWRGSWVPTGTQEPSQEINSSQTSLCQPSQAVGLKEEEILLCCFELRVWRQSHSEPKEQEVIPRLTLLLLGLHQNFPAVTKEEMLLEYLKKMYKKITFQKQLKCRPNAQGKFL